MAAASIASNASPSYLYYRHTLPVRIMHWTNFIALTVLFMSGLHIFNAHSALYWGDSSYLGAHRCCKSRHAMVARVSVSVSHACLAASSKPPACSGFRNIRTVNLTRTRFLRGSRFPADIACDGARLAFLLRVDLRLSTVSRMYCILLFSRHLMRDLTPTGRELRGIGTSIVDHVKFKHPSGEAAKRGSTCCKSSPT